jgi:mRNA interferase RelE/StbE
VAERYRVEWDRAAEKTLARLPESAQSALRKIANDLAENPWPEGCSKMEGTRAQWKKRTGNYRLVWAVTKRETLVTIVAADDRSRVYRR